MAEHTSLKVISDRLKEVLELDGSPVAVAYVSEPQVSLKKWARHSTICIMVQKARRGEAFYSKADRVICGGKVHLGLSESAGRDLNSFLVKTEKLAASHIASQRLLGLTRSRAPEKMGQYIAFAPLEKAPFTPDIVVFVAMPLQTSRIVLLDAYETGRINTIHGEPLCSGAIAAPFTRRRIGMSFMDNACRSFGRYKPEEMVIGVPYERLERIVESIEKSVAGKAKPGLLLRLLPKIIRA